MCVLSCKPDNSVACIYKLTQIVCKDAPLAGLGGSLVATYQANLPISPPLVCKVTEFVWKFKCLLPWSRFAYVFCIHRYKQVVA